MASENARYKNITLAVSIPEAYYQNSDFYSQCVDYTLCTTINKSLSDDYDREHRIDMDFSISASSEAEMKIQLNRYTQKQYSGTANIRRSADSLAVEVQENKYSVTCTASLK